MESGQEVEFAVDEREEEDAEDTLSFEARMQERRRQRERRTTEIFDVPGFEELFKVELRAVGYKQLANITTKHQRERDEAMRILYNASDAILVATVAFHKIMSDESLREAKGGTWATMARAFDPTLDNTVRPRAALIRLLEGQGVIELYNDWYAWNGRGNQAVEKELTGDFPGTR